MGALNIIGPMLFIAGVATAVLVAVAIVQDIRSHKKHGFRQAFYTIVSLVMLVMAVAAAVSIITVTLKASVLPKADNSTSLSYPPTYYRAVAPTCAKDCQFTADDKTAFTQWKADYQKWKDAQNPEQKGLSQQLRQDLASSLAIFIVTLPLYLLFARWMNKGAVEETKEDKRTSPLRSVYFYGLALAGLIMAVVAAAMLLNIGLKMAFHTDDASTNGVVRPTAIDVGSFPTEKSNIQTVIDCAAKCDFSAADVSLAKQWITDYDNATKGTSYSDNQATLASMIPLFLLGAPLFWFHFARIRKETTA